MCTSQVRIRENSVCTSQVVSSAQAEVHSEENKLILLDGGATHDVKVSASTAPEGAVEECLELAHGSTPGYVLGGEVTIIDSNATAEDEQHPRLVSLGRLIAECNLVLTWVSDGAFLKLPDGSEMTLVMKKYCPHGTPKDLENLNSLRATKRG